MSQLNLKEIISSDTLSSLVDKINYNFNQVVLNGGGPRGATGIIGPPGLPGLQGIEGNIGSTGDDGTRVYISTTGPSYYTFGLSGESTPRIDDLFIEANVSYMNLWKMLTGSTGWGLIQTMVAPTTGLSKLIYDPSNDSDVLLTSLSNDPSKACKFYFGTSASFPYSLDSSHPITSTDPEFSSELSILSNYGDSLFTLAGEENQLRILDINRSGGDRGKTGGGIIHSVETSTGKQVYRILNGDIIGNNHFSISLNSNPGNKLLYGNTYNKLGIGVSEFSSLTAQASIEKSAVIGRSSKNFYSSSSVVLKDSIGLLTEGNFSVGRNNNTYATGGFYNISGSYGSSVWIDTSRGTSQNAKSDLYIGSGMYDYASNPVSNQLCNYWKFRCDGSSYAGNTMYGNLILTSYQTGGLFGTGASGTLGSVATMGLTSDGTMHSSQISVNSSILHDVFEIGNSIYNKIAIGQQEKSFVSGNMLMHIGFNVSRNPVVSDSWRRGNDETDNGGTLLWSSLSSGFGFSMFPSSGPYFLENITDKNVYESTRAFIGASGNLTISEKNNASSLSSLGYSFFDDFEAQGTTGEGTDSGKWRRFLGCFGTASSLKGSPLIAMTNGIEQGFEREIFDSNGMTASVVPHFTWKNSELYGMYLSQGTTANGASGESVGIAANGNFGLVVTGMTAGIGRVGVFQKNPVSRMHIGEKFVIGDDTKKFIGYNIFENYSSHSEHRIVGSTASGETQSGSFKVEFIDNEIVDGASSLNNRFSNLGTKLVLVPYGVGGTVSELDDSVSGKNFTGLIISPAPVGPTSDWINKSSHVPQVSIGLNSSTFVGEQDSTVSLKRGTLSIASQFRTKPSGYAFPTGGPFGYTIEDEYNIGLYDYNGNPISGLYVSGGDSYSTNKTFGMNFLGTGGNAIAQDISLLFSSTDKDLTKKYTRVANFGDGFRVGIDYVPETQTMEYSNTSDPIYDYSALVVGGYSEGIPGGYEQAIISKGIVTIDQSIYSGGDGGNQGLIFKDNSINSSKRVNEYLGDWGIQYTKTGNAAGLNFWKPSGSLSGLNNFMMFLSDSGSLGIGATSFDYISTSGNTYPPSSFSTLSISSSEAKMNVNGAIICSGIITSSDFRLKKEILSMKDSLEKVMKMNPITFSWKDDESNSIFGGFIAQEMNEILPESVKIVSDSKLEGGRYTLDYNAIVATLAGSIKEQQNIIENQNKKINDFENKIKNMEEEIELLFKLINKE